MSSIEFKEHCIKSALIVNEASVNLAIKFNQPLSLAIMECMKMKIYSHIYDTESV